MLHSCSLDATLTSLAARGAFCSRQAALVINNRRMPNFSTLSTRMTAPVGLSFTLALPPSLSHIACVVSRSNFQLRLQRQLSNLNCLHEHSDGDHASLTAPNRAAQSSCGAIKDHGSRLGWPLFTTACLGINFCFISLSLSLRFCCAASARVRFNRHFCADKRRARIVRLSVRQPPSQPQFLADSGGQLTRVPHIVLHPPRRRHSWSPSQCPVPGRSEGEHTARAARESDA